MDLYSIRYKIWRDRVILSGHVCFWTLHFHKIIRSKDIRCFKMLDKCHRRKLKTLSTQYTSMLTINVFFSMCFSYLRTRKSLYIHILRIKFYSMLVLSILCGIFLNSWFNRTFRLTGIISYLYSKKSSDYCPSKMCI